MPSVIEKYGAKWAAGTDDLEIEFGCIRKGGKWINKAGAECGLGLFEHYKNAQKLLWPDDYHHRWSDLQLSEILNNTITCIIGPKDTGKTHVALVRYGLTDYFVFPDETLIILSSTTLSALEGRVWGDMKSMFQKAKDRYDWLPGHPLESKHAICTDDLDDESVLTRDMRKGILCVPCKNASGQVLSIASYVGMKQKRRRHLGDEFQFMSSGMLDSVANMNSGDYKGVFVGNPIGQDDPLDKVTEPDCGWDSLPEPTATTVWNNKRFLKSRTICLYGPDSPTNDFHDGVARYPGLINTDSIQRVVSGYGKDSHQYYSQCLGVRRAGLNARRVITRELCKKHKAFSDEVLWSSEKRVRIAAADLAYGGCGGDRAVGGWGEFGKDSHGKTILLVHPPTLIPVSIKKDYSPEDQLAAWVKTYCEGYEIDQSNFFYDSTGRGSFGPALARLGWTQMQPVEFGGTATDRPVSLDTYVWDPQQKKNIIKTCKMAYSKFVTELWWSTRFAIECEQIRGLPQDVAEEGCAREWIEVSGQFGARVEVESKRDMKERCGFSPDLYDWFVTLLEGARRRGFQISKLANDAQSKSQSNPFKELQRKQSSLLKSKELVPV